MTVIPQRTVSPATIRAKLQASEELAFLDVREEGPHSCAQPLFAVNVPLTRLELDVGRLVPRVGVPIVVFADDLDLSQRAASRLVALGYQDVAVVEEGLDGWRRGGKCSATSMFPANLLANGWTRTGTRP